MIATQAQAYQAVIPDAVAHALIVDPDGPYPCYPIIGDRCWIGDLDERARFNNERPGCVIATTGSQGRSGNTALCTGILSVRIFGGSDRLSDCNRVWTAIMRRLTLAGGREYTIDKMDFSARWLWAVVVASPTIIRKHPVTQWPEYNCTLEYGVQGI